MKRSKTSVKGSMLNSLDVIATKVATIMITVAASHERFSSRSAACKVSRESSCLSSV